jgi:hypothetical protein
LIQQDGVAANHIIVQDASGQPITNPEILQLLAQEMQMQGVGGAPPGHVIIRSGEGEEEGGTHVVARMMEEPMEYTEQLPTEDTGGYDPAALLAAAEHIENEAHHALESAEAVNIKHDMDTETQLIDPNILAQMQQGQEEYQLDQEEYRQQVQAEEYKHQLQTEALGGEMTEQQEQLVNDSEQGYSGASEGQALEFTEASEEIQQLCMSQGLLNEQGGSGPVVIYTVELPAGRTALSEEDLMMLANKLGIQM